jgi:2-aminoadipate transaminase
MKEHIMKSPRYARRVLDLKMQAEDGAEIISFGSGEAYPEGLPDMGDLAQVAASRYRQETMQYSAWLGLADMREWIVEYVAQEGVKVSVDQVLVVNGAKQAIDLAGRVFLEPGDVVVVTAPTYKSAVRIFRSHEVHYIEVPIDEQGMDVAALAGRLAECERRGQPMPKLVYDVPEFHNPTGITMSAERRQALVALAERYDFMVVEDDPYRRIRFEGDAVPPIQAFDTTGHAIGIGTFAKLVAPGLRLGWVTAAPDVIKKLAVVKADGGSCPLTQRLILEYVKAGRLMPHIQEVTGTYRGQRDIMLEALRRYLPETTCRVPHGGYYIWLKLPERVSGDALAQAAIRRGVRVLPASDFYVTSGPANYVRLAYSYSPPSAIAEGIRRLGEAFREIA